MESTLNADSTDWTGGTWVWLPNVLEEEDAYIVRPNIRDQPQDAGNHLIRYPDHPR